MAAAPSRARSMLRALSHRNYRLFFAGQSISLIGTWLSRVATSWLVYRVTDSEFLLGVIAFCSQIPIFVFSSFTGALVERWNRHRVLVVTQVLSMLQSFALAALALSGIIEVWHVAVLSLLQGGINAFDTPARQAFAIEMVEGREDLPNAIALNSSMVNVARFIGPSAAGFLIHWLGEGGCFLIDGVSYAAVIASLLAMRVKPRAIETTQRDLLGEMRQGFGYAFSSPPIRAAITLVALMSLAGAPYLTLLPVMAREVLRGGASTLGYLMAASGVGAVVGAVYLASRRNVVGLGRVIVLSAGSFGLALIAFTFSRTLWLSLPLMSVAGFGMMVQMAASNTVLQTLVEDRMRGRLMGIFTMAFLGTAPFGTLAAGALASRIGAPVTLALGGAVCVMAASYFAYRLPALRAHVRPVYERLGILPEIALGLRAAPRQ